MNAMTSARRAAHDAHLAAQRGVVTGSHTFAQVDAAHAAFCAACDAEHDEAARVAAEERRVDLEARAIANAAAARRRIAFWGV